jgi:acylpyruvate hydrolase
MTRFASARIDGRGRAAVIAGETATLLPYEDVGELLRSGPDWQQRAQEAGGESLALADLDFAPVIPAPEKIVCVGLNYRDHAAEAGREIPDYPQLFAKYSSALIGAHDPITLPSVSEKVDWEAELGVVIGRRARHVDESEALSYVAGFTVANDVSVRDWQRRTTQYLQGKTFEGTTPVGPWLTSVEEVGDPGALQISCSLDGETVQDFSTAEMIFKPAQLVAYISQILTLVPGDLIITGTGAGVGALRDPQRFLTASSRLRTTIEGIGTLENLCVAESVRGGEQP